MRQARSCEGLEGIKHKLKTLKEDENNKNLQSFFLEFLHNISAFFDIKNQTNIANYFSHLILAIERFSGKSFSNLLAVEPFKEELEEVFIKIKSLHNFSCNGEDFSIFLRNLLSQINCFNKNAELALIDILSPIEARLLNFDVVILASLNSGNFPQIEGEGWLGRGVRKELGIDLTMQKIGQNA